MYGLMFWEGLRVQKTKPRSLSPQKPVLVLFTVCHHRARTKNGARKEDQNWREEEDLPLLKARMRIGQKNSDISWF